MFLAFYQISAILTLDVNVHPQSFSQHVHANVQANVEAVCSSREDEGVASSTDVLGGSSRVPAPTGTRDEPQRCFW